MKILDIAFKDLLRSFRSAFALVMMFVVDSAADQTNVMIEPCSAKLNKSVAFISTWTLLQNRVVTLPANLMDNDVCVGWGDGHFRRCPGSVACSHVYEPLQKLATSQHISSKWLVKITAKAQRC